MSSATKLVEPHSVLTQDGAGFISWQTDDLVPTPVSTRAWRVPVEKDRLEAVETRALCPG